MRGIPSSSLLLFFVVVFLIEIIAFSGTRFLIKQHFRTGGIFITSCYLFIGLAASALLFFSFIHPEVLRQARNYDFFSTVILISILNLIPKFVFAVFTLLSYFARLFSGPRIQLIMLYGALLLGSGLFLVIVSGNIWGRNDLHIEKHNVYFDSWPRELDGFRIVQISDLHLGSFGQNTNLMKETVERINKADPDLLLFTGDLVNNFGSETSLFKTYLNDLSARFGKFAILGNHDYGDYSSWSDSVSKQENLQQIENSLTETGFDLLLNRSVIINAKDTSFTLIGVENWGRRPFPQYANLEQALAGIDKKSFQILMSHDPSHWSNVIVPQTDIPFTLSGHTHGGQMGIKIAGILFSPIYLIQEKWGGLYKTGKQQLYVNKGLGTIGFRGRIDMRPEITVLNVYRTKSL